MAKSNCPAEDSAPPQASAGQLTPRFLPLSLSGRLLQVTVAISPSAAKGASKGERFSACIRSEGPPQANAGFQKVGERGASAAKQKLKPSGSSDWTSGRGVAVRFGAASCASLVIEFCQQGGILSFGGEFFPIVCFCWLGMGRLLSKKFPSLCVF